MMMYPHGLHRWIGLGLPAAVEEAGVGDNEAWKKLQSVILRPDLVGAKDLTARCFAALSMTRLLRLFTELTPTLCVGAQNDVNVSAVRL